MTPRFSLRFGRSSARLLDEQRTQNVPPELVLTQLLGLRANLASRLGSAVPLGLSARARVAYEVLTGVEALAAAEARLHYGVPLDPVCHALAVQLDDLITAHVTAAEGSLSTLQKEEFRRTLAKHLVAAEFAEERAWVIAGRLMERLALQAE